MAESGARAVYRSLRDRLASAGIPDPELDARILMEAFTGLGLTDLVRNPERPVDATDADRLDAALAARISGIPVHRIVGHRDFFGVRLALGPDTLEPRPDTEALVELALPRIRAIAATKGRCRVLDLGTGTGAIAIAILRHVPLATVVATDIAPGALDVAVRNAVANGVEARFEARRSDWLAEIDGGFDAILSNPPYIRSDVIAGLDSTVREHDPLRALDGGADGLDAYRIIARDARRVIEPTGFTAVEIGFDQHDAVGAIFREAGWREAESARDLGGHSRARAFLP